MKKIIIYLTLSLLLIAAVIGLAYQHNLYRWQNSPQTLWIINGYLFDATDEYATENSGILIQQGIITCLGAHCEKPADAKIIDAKNKAILPGMIELHGHFFGSSRPRPGQSQLQQIWRQFQFMPYARKKLLQAGVTSYRSLGDLSPAIFTLKEMLADQEIAGPRMFITGPLFTVAGGHPTQKKEIPRWLIEHITFQSDNPVEVSRKIKELANEGVDGIKVVYQSHTDNNGNLVMPRISKDTLQSIADEASKHGLWLAVHTGNPLETDEAIAVGMTSIEHGIRHGHRITPSTLSQIKAKGIVYVPTLAREPKGYLNIPALSQADIMIGVGTDSPIETETGSNGFHAELYRLVDAGLSPAKTLIAATRHGALAINQLKTLGTIEVGKKADVIIVAGKPWINIHDIANIDTVVIGGRLAVNTTGQ